VELPLGLGAQFVALGLVIGDEEQLVVVPQSRFVVNASAEADNRDLLWPVFDPDH